ncbi:hypothetical protein EVAR_24856_1 [Eumeta japonica]|uniref:Reverse transcriptase domain-containing protein n=1 Tax=Eumeta variegata TaxID=151549 RepID=A0A4C1Y8P8_EUMVA|nr:hypothetical protein EVAR_24856_1 [Eumeta japonica]
MKRSKEARTGAGGARRPSRIPLFRLLQLLKGLLHARDAPPAPVRAARAARAAGAAAARLRSTQNHSEPLKRTRPEYKSSGRFVVNATAVRPPRQCCPRLGRQTRWYITDWFDIRRGVRRGCVASPWLFNLFMDSCLYDLKEYERGLRIDELPVNCLLYADNQVILVPSACGLQ